MSPFDRPSAPPAHPSNTSPRRNRPASLHRSANRSPTPAPLRRALFRRRAAPLEGAEWAMKRGGWAKNAVVWSTCRRYIVHGLALRELQRQPLPG